jgi:hypothetical protein
VVSSETAVPRALMSLLGLLCALINPCFLSKGLCPPPSYPGWEICVTHDLQGALI